MELGVPVRQVLAGLDASLQAPLFNPASSTGTITIAATDNAQRAIAVCLFSALTRRAPRMPMAPVAIDDAQLPLQGERGDIDLALMTADTAPPGLHGRRLFDEAYVRDAHQASGNGAAPPRHQAMLRIRPCAGVDGWRAPVNPILFLSSHRILRYHAWLAGQAPCACQCPAARFAPVGAGRGNMLPTPTVQESTCKTSKAAPPTNSP